MKRYRNTIYFTLHSCCYVEGNRRTRTVNFSSISNMNYFMWIYGSLAIEWNLIYGSLTAWTNRVQGNTAWDDMVRCSYACIILAHVHSLQRNHMHQWEQNPCTHWDIMFTTTPAHACEVLLSYTAWLTSSTIRWSLDYALWLDHFKNACYAALYTCGRHDVNNILKSFSAVTCTLCNLKYSKLTKLLYLSVQKSEERYKICIKWKSFIIFLMKKGSSTRIVNPDN